ncbi:hypothetical protein HAZT_HAZT001301 [Hyalella azteca]|uniref:Uncharacterized protein n=1 Tax=Hyalella azteca TaxID=294128 RepID=A0A6A0H5G8_HYAAZ|nr:hypothetical protein HAZT_HAZT001301 [Hyalella azteca]
MSSKRKSLPTKVLDASVGWDPDVSADVPTTSPVESHALLVTPADSDNSDGGFPSPVNWTDAGELTGKNLPDDGGANFNGNNGTYNGPIVPLHPNGSRRHPEGPPAHVMDHPLPPFVNPFFQLHEARLLHDHMQHQQHMQHLQHYNIPPPHFSPMEGGRGAPNPMEGVRGMPPSPMEGVRGIPPNPIEGVRGIAPNPMEGVRGIPPNPMEGVRGMPPDGGYMGCRRSMDEVLRRLVSKISCSSLEEGERLAPHTWVLSEYF